jgi:hypothetical protein
VAEGVRHFFRISASVVVACVLCGMGENTPGEWAYGSPAIPKLPLAHQTSIRR